MQSPSAYNRQNWKGLSDEEREIVQARLDNWVKANKVRPYEGKGNHCLKKLVNHRHRCVTESCWDSEIPGKFQTLDHAELWVQETGSFIVTAHPYGLYKVEELENWCHEQELDYQIEPHDASWYLPKGTALIMIKGK